MEETFLCFEIEAALFLIPLELVKHIIPGNNGEGPVYYNGSEVRLSGFCRFSDRERAACGRYIVLLNGTEEDQGFSADEVRGIYTVSQGRQKDIPGEAIGTDNSCLLKAAYVEELASWAFIVKPDIFLRQRGIE